MSIQLSISFKGETSTVEVPHDTTFGDLQDMIEERSSVPAANQKLFAPKVGMVRVDKLPGGADTLVGDVFPEAARKKINLMGTPVAELKERQEAEEEMEKAAAKHRQRVRRSRKMGYWSVSKESKRALATPVATSSSSSEYTFHKLAPLRFLPYPEKSLQFMERLRDDRGIQAIMNKYKWSVPVMTELDPSSNTSQTGRLLGLNRNKGEVIELRLRTDDYDGWCNYNEVRKVLCHELTHNVHGEHDSKFWELCRKLEKEVVQLDPFGGKGKALTNQEFYDGPGLAHNEEELDHCDHGGWVGSEQKLGTLADAAVDAAGRPPVTKTQLQMRDILRQAAEARKKRESDADKK